MRDFYVDDLLTGTNTVEEARKQKTELIQLLSAAGMNVRKWASNNPYVFEELNNSDLERMIQTDKDPKTLGLLWAPAADELRYSVQQTPNPSITKRTILSTIAQIFHPLGLVGPAVIRAKIILQNLRQLKLGWDETLPQNLYTTWKEFHSHLRALNEITVPRFVLGANIVTVQLHGFSGASTVAYGTCIYLRSSDSVGNHNVRLLCTKSQVAPLKQINWPRLELQAALVLAHLSETVSAALSVEIKEKYFWSDSTITLGWILSYPTRWPTSVANRTSEMQRLTNDNWNHFLSGENPADLISREINPEDLHDQELWWMGPD
ncbi:uncharacterized protein LOC117176446 [Belonocnema kinseyi]|uniref:uncharacterized protein LOC117176446 n=1 Tax=Belonocnema kinseyi TaxID=2817044 RepID=UPI00143D12BF|nr:uncharacterized protein LOC117176446 [Belonocnema kinseyi]